MSWEGVTQGNPLSMFLYGIVLKPLMGYLQAISPSVLQPWYANDTALMGLHADNAKCLTALKAASLWFGSFLEPEFPFTSAWLTKKRLTKPPLQQWVFKSASLVGEDMLAALLGQKSRQENGLD